jgi:sugar/nucleoside kinase (ribokinase family)
VRTLIVGSVALDHLRTPAGEASALPGGSCLFTSLVCALFAPVAVVGVVGSDFPEATMRAWRDRGVDLSGLVLVDGPTYHWHARQDPLSGESVTLAMELGASEGVVPSVPAALRRCDLLFLGSTDPSAHLSALAELDERPWLVIADSMAFWMERDQPGVDAVFAQTDVITLNEAELRAWTGLEQPLEAAGALLERYPRLLGMVLKRGLLGAQWLPRVGPAIDQPAPRLAEVRDPTGAGDCLAGGMLASAATAGGELHWGAMLALGVVAASACVTEWGTAALRDMSRAELEQQVRTLPRPGPVVGWATASAIG